MKNMSFMFLFCFSISCFAQTYEVTVLGVSSTKQSGEIFSQFTPLVNYLSRNVYSGMVKGGVKLRVYKSQTDLLRAFTDGTVQLARMEPQTYFRLKSQMPSIILIVGELQDGEFKREGALIVQKFNKVKNFGDFKNSPFAFGPKTDPLLDIVAKSVLAQRGLGIQDIKTVYLRDQDKLKHFVEVGRVRGGVIDLHSMGKDEILEKFRVFVTFTAPNMVWVISDKVFLSTREKIEKEFLFLEDTPILSLLGVGGFKKIHETELFEFKENLKGAMAFHQKK